MTTTIVSAPGKVLLAGGYLVLDPAYSGLVVATSSRFYCVVRPASSSTSSGITVRAGQFPSESSIWSYTLNPVDSGLDVKADGEGKNKFVEISLRNAVQVVVEMVAAREGLSAGKAAKRVLESTHGGLEVVVLADNDFYSQRDQLAALSLPPLYASLDSLPPFAPLFKPIHQTNKTGLGSSAGLVTSLTAGLLAHFGVVSLPTSTQSDDMHHSSSSSSTDLDLVHNLAQFSHCLAQGKVGSGFDISSAVYGTHTYRRFSPSILAPLLTGQPAALLPALDRSGWDHQTAPFALPRGLRLMLADVDAGTDTPSFVGKVLKWREANRDAADELWGDLGRANDALGQELRDLAGLAGGEGYEAALVQAAEQRIEQIARARPESDKLVRIRETLLTIRSYLQQMSRLSGVSIEPEEQTRLLDACSALPGVLGGGVPGAGGYDAIFLLVVDRPEVITAVETVWSGWTEMSVCPLSARQSDGGLRTENVDGLRGLKERLA